MLTMLLWTLGTLVLLAVCWVWWLIYDSRRVTADFDRLQGLRRNAPPGQLNAYLSRAARSLPLILLCWYGYQTSQYVPVWHSDATLWAHARTIAPQKQRVLTQHGTALLIAGQYQYGWFAYRDALLAADLPHVPAYDRQNTRLRIEQNAKAAIAAKLPGVRER